MSSGGGGRGQSGYGRGRSRGNGVSRGGGANNGSNRPQANISSSGSESQSSGASKQVGGGGSYPGNNGQSWNQKAGGGSGGNWPLPGGSGPPPGSNGPPLGAPNPWHRQGGASAGPPGIRMPAANGAPPGIRMTGANGAPAGTRMPGAAGPAPGPPRNPCEPRPPRNACEPAPGRNGAARGQRDEGGRKRGWGAREGDKVEDSRDDVVETRKEGIKKGVAGTPVVLLSNYFTLVKRADWSLYHYRVDFKPDEESTKFRKALFRNHAVSVGTHMFDGYDLYTAHRLHPDPMVLFSLREPDQSSVELHVRLVDEISPFDATMLHFYNIIVRKCLQSLKLDEIGRNFFDSKAARTDNNLGLEFWPGYMTSMRQCENNVLLRVEIKHKLVRKDSVWVGISAVWNRSNYKELVKSDVVGTIVMTHYNKKTYKISDVMWDLTPLSTFEHKGNQITYMEYYEKRHNVKIRYTDQPLLIAMPKKRDFHRGDAGPIYLVPELCQTTGLTDSMRSDQRLMRDIATNLHIEPQARVMRIENFMKRLRDEPTIQTDLENWGLRFENRLVNVPGRILPKERIFFAPKTRGGPKTEQTVTEKAEWTLQSRDYPMTKSVPLKNWVVIVWDRDSSKVNSMVSTMQLVAGQLGFIIPPPIETFVIQNSRPQGFVRGIDDAMQRYGGNLDLIFTLLPANKVDTYAAIKRRCLNDLGISSQVFLAKHIESRNFKSIATKLVIQMNAKLGGIPWEVDVPVPLKDCMMIGFDVCHLAGEKGKSVGALVASTNVSWGEYYSTTSIHETREDMSKHLCADMTKALNAYKHKNNRLPARIVFFRDGVGEGQLAYIYHTELDQIKTALKGIYDGIDQPKFSFIVVTKRIETRLFTAPVRVNDQSVNPVPGTVVDDVITLPERHDFFLVSQTTRNGTVSPTAYHVLHDEQGFTAGLLQMLTYKMCHLYFNCSTSVAVPAPCQYAHKLAYLAGVALGNGSCKENLANQLYYL